MSLALSVALNLFFVGGALWIRLHSPADWGSQERRYQRMAAELDLDAQQRVGFDRYVAAMRARMQRHGAEVFAPSNRLATDNAAMIARAGLFHLEHGERSPLDLNAFASLPLPGLAD